MQIDAEVDDRERLAVDDVQTAGDLTVRLTAGALARFERLQQALPQRQLARLRERLEHRLGDAGPDDGVGRGDDVVCHVVSAPRSIAGPRARGGASGLIERAELTALGKPVRGRELLDHPGRGEPLPEQMEAEMTEARIARRLRDDRAHAGRDVDAARADGHLARRDRDAEHAGALAAADDRERAFHGCRTTVYIV